MVIHLRHCNQRIPESSLLKEADVLYRKRTGKCNHGLCVNWRKISQLNSSMYIQVFLNSVSLVKQLVRHETLHTVNDVDTLHRRYEANVWSHDLLSPENEIWQSTYLTSWYMATTVITIVV